MAPGFKGLRASSPTIYPCFRNALNASPGMDVSAPVMAGLVPAIHVLVRGP